MSIAKLAPKPFLGAQIPFVKVTAPKVDEIIDVVNDLTTRLEVLEALLELGSGVSGTFLSADGTALVITVTNGIITSIVED